MLTSDKCCLELQIESCDKHIYWVFIILRYTDFLVSLLFIWMSIFQQEYHGNQNIQSPFTIYYAICLINFERKTIFRNYVWCFLLFLFSRITKFQWKPNWLLSFCVYGLWMLHSHIFSVIFIHIHAYYGDIAIQWRISQMFVVIH